MRLPIFSRPQIVRWLSVFIPLSLLPLVRIAMGGDHALSAAQPSVRAELVNVPTRVTGAGAIPLDSLTGRSRQLRVMLFTGEEADASAPLRQRCGTESTQPGIRTQPFDVTGQTFACITLTPWREKKGTFIHTYHVGYWPGERSLMPAGYRNPDGFVAIMPQDARLRLSTHFTLRDFITHDQEEIWPKFVVLREELLDKLELVLGALQERGVSTSHVVVLSGFRTPQYNAQARMEGAAYASRHQYGDAADVIIDADGDGRMDDLNHDGIVDFRDTDVINSAVERVEHQYPELVGGLGLYHATGPRGPFAHIDVRGTRARWTNTIAVAKSSTPNYDFSAGYNAATSAVGKCKAEGAFAALCGAVK